MVLEGYNKENNCGLEKSKPERENMLEREGERKTRELATKRSVLRLRWSPVFMPLSDYVCMCVCIHPALQQEHFISLIFT